MSLRKRTLGIISMTFFVLLAMLYWVSRVTFLDSFAKLETEYTQQGVRRVLHALEEQLNALDHSAYDWAAWDDTYRFVQDRNKTYIASNLVDSTFSGAGFNLMLFVDTEGELVFGKCFDLQAGEAVSLPESLALHLRRGVLLQDTVNSSLTGILSFPQGPMLIAAQPIVTSEEEGPVQGTFILGRYLDAGRIATLAQTTSVSLTGYLVSDPYLPDAFRQPLVALSVPGAQPLFVTPLDAEWVAGYAILDDIYGDPTFLLEASMPRDIYRQGEDGLSYFLLLLGIVGISFGVLILLLLEKLVLNRLAVLSNSVSIISETGTLSLRVDVAGDDELANLGEKINVMLGALEHSAVALEQQLSRVSLLNQITRSIAERQDLRSIFHALLSRLEEQLPLDIACLSLLDAESDTLLLSVCGPSGEQAIAQLACFEGMRTPVDGSGLEACVRNGEMMYVSDLTRVESPMFEQLLKSGGRAFVGLPLGLERQRFGVLILVRNNVDAFDHAEREFLLGLSQHVSLAIHQAKLYQELQEAYMELHQTQQVVMKQERLKALGQMASGIAHDINNALTPAVIYTDLLLKRPDFNEKGRKQLEAVHLACADVVQTVLRMREFYRKREDVERLRPFDLNAIVQQVLDLTRPRWKDMPQARGIVVRTRTELEQPLPELLGVESEIREALTNLILNAVDAMPEGGLLTLRTRLERRLQRHTGILGEERRYVLLEVSDTGVGMDQEMLNHCFEPFFSTKGSDGTGLGLAMVYGIMQRHGGAAEVQSALGQGTTIRLLFPLQEVLPALQQDAPEVLEPMPPLRVLCVDDNVALLESLKELLEAEGHAVMALEGGQMGMDAFYLTMNRGQPFDVVITDLGMPYLDGRQIARAVKDVWPTAFVILLTGWGAQLKEDQELPRGVDYILSKPPRLDELRKVLAQVRVRMIAGAPPLPAGDGFAIN